MKGLPTGVRDPPSRFTPTDQDRHPRRHPHQLHDLHSASSSLIHHCHDLCSLSIVRPQPMDTSLSTPPHLFTNFISTIVRIITITICFTCRVHQSLLKKIISFVDALPSLSFLSHDEENGDNSIFLTSEIIQLHCEHCD